MSAARLRYTLVAGATAVVVGAGFTVAGLTRHSSDASPSSRSADVPLVAPEPPIFGSEDPGLLPSEEAASAIVSASPSRTAVSPSASATTSRRPAPRRTSAKPATTRPRTRPPAAPQTSGSVLDQVLSHINEARDDENLPALRLDRGLSRAAALHNQRMIDGCGLSHQCSGEGGVGERFSAQGVQWRAAGENIGFGSAGSSTAAIAGAANGLTDSMLAEVPPDDGHRKNLLSRTFTRIGLSVVRDDRGRVWMTQDFVG
jgi:uncharacterized protein YkwD